MSEQQANYNAGNMRDQEIINALREVLRAGYGKVIITIADHQIKEIETSTTVRIAK